MEYLIPSRIYQSKSEIETSVALALDELLESHSALDLYAQLKQLELATAAGLAKLREMAISDALSLTGGAMGKAEALRGVEVSVKMLPKKYTGYSDAVTAKEAEIEIAKEQLKSLKKVDELTGTAVAVEQGCTVQVSFRK